VLRPPAGSPRPMPAPPTATAAVCRGLRRWLGGISPPLVAIRLGPCHVLAGPSPPRVVRRYRPRETLPPASPALLTPPVSVSLLFPQVEGGAEAGTDIFPRPCPRPPTSTGPCHALILTGLSGAPPAAFSFSHHVLCPRPPVLSSFVLSLCLAFFCFSVCLSFVPPPSHRLYFFLLCLAASPVRGGLMARGLASRARTRAFLSPDCLGHPSGSLHCSLHASRRTPASYHERALAAPPRLASVACAAGLAARLSRLPQGVILSSLAGSVAILCLWKLGGVTARL
jgi:hypothetical protein